MEKNLAIDLFKTFLTLKNPILTKGKNDDDETFIKVSDSEYNIVITILIKHCGQIISGVIHPSSTSSSHEIDIRELNELSDKWHSVKYAQDERNKSKTADHSCDAVQYMLHGIDCRCELGDFPDYVIPIYTKGYWKNKGKAIDFADGGKISDFEEPVKLNVKEVNDILKSIKEKSEKAKKQVTVLDAVTEYIQQTQSFIDKLKS